MFIEKEENSIPSSTEKLGILLGLAGIGLTVGTMPAAAGEYNHLGFVAAAVPFIFVFLTVLSLRNTAPKDRTKRMLMMVIFDLEMITILLLSFRIFM